MEQEIMLDEVKENPSDGRPVFLTVLCILTWIGSGFTFLSAIYSLLTLKVSQQAFQEADINFSELANELPESDDPADKFARGMMEGMGESMDAMLEWGSTLNLVSMGVSIACVLGALLMFRLNKIGFFIYTLATIVSIVTPIVLLGNNMIAVFSTSIGGLIGIVFIILYGVNLKQMKS